MWNIVVLSERPNIYNNTKLFDHIPFNDHNWMSTKCEKYQNFMNIEYKDKMEFVKRHVEFFDFTRFIELFNDVIVLDLDSVEICNLLEVCLFFQQIEIRTFNESDLARVNPTLLEKIENILNQENGTSWFVKTSFKSSKYFKHFPNKTLTPSNNIIDIFNNLVLSSDVTVSLLRDNIKLIFRPWNYLIKKEYEFRLFIFDGILKNISQSYSSIYIHLNDPKNTLNRILTFWKELDLKLQSLYYHHCDMTIDIFCSESEIGLIEINSGGIWSTCGSCLFDFNNMPEYEFRYLQNI